MTATAGAYNGRQFRSTLTKLSGTDRLGTVKVYRIALTCGGATAGHIEFKARATAGCCSVKGIKTQAVEFDDIALEPPYQGGGLSFLLIWCAAMKATHKGYTNGNVKSVSTVASFATFSRAGFPGLAGQDAKSIGLVTQLLAGTVLPGNTKLRAESGDVTLAIIRGICEPRIQATLGAAPTYVA